MWVSTTKNCYSELIILVFSKKNSWGIRRRRQASSWVRKWAWREEKRFCTLVCSTDPTDAIIIVVCQASSLSWTWRPPGHGQRCSTRTWSRSPPSPRGSWSSQSCPWPPPGQHLDRGENTSLKKKKNFNFKASKPVLWSRSNFDRLPVRRTAPVPGEKKLSTKI